MIVADGPAVVRKNCAAASWWGNRSRYRARHPAKASPATDLGMSAHTLPPNPAPNADEATALSRADSTSQRVSGT